MAEKKASAAPGGAVRAGIAFSLMCAACYAMNPVFAKLGYRAGLEGIEILEARFFFAVAVLAVAGPLLEKGFYRFDKRLVLHSLGIAALILIPLNLLYVYALKDIPASMMALITYVYPAVVLAINAVVFSKPVGRRQIVSVAFILIGCVCIFSDAFGTRVAPFALALGFLSMLMYGIYLLALQQVSRGVSALKLTFLTLAMSLAGLWAIHPPFFMAGMDASQLSITFGYGFVSTVLSTLFLSKAIQLFGATETGIFCSFEPAFTIIFACLILGEPVPVFRWLGMAVLISGIVLPNYRAVLGLFNKKNQMFKGE